MAETISTAVGETGLPAAERRPPAGPRHPRHILLLLRSWKAEERAREYMAQNLSRAHSSVLSPWAGMVQLGDSIPYSHAALTIPLPSLVMPVLLAAWVHVTG